MERRIELDVTEIKWNSVCCNGSDYVEISIAVNVAPTDGEFFGAFQARRNWALIAGRAIAAYLQSDSVKLAGLKCGLLDAMGRRPLQVICRVPCGAVSEDVTELLGQSITSSSGFFVENSGIFVDIP